MRPNRESSPAEFALQALDNFVDSLVATRRENARPLRQALLRIGSELLTLVDALKQHADRGKIVFGSWEDLRLAWLAMSGNDLDVLTPSAAEAIHQFIPLLDTIWTRAELLRHTRDGKIECRWPDGALTSRIDRVDEIPIGYATIRSGCVETEVTVLDRVDLGIHTLSAAEHEIPHFLKDGYCYKVSHQPFMSGRPGIASVRLFSNRHSATDDNLHYWGGWLQAGARNSAATTSRREPSGLVARTVWKWRGGRWALVVESVRATLPDGDNYSLTLGDITLWRGSVSNGWLAAWRRHVVHTDKLCGIVPLVIELENSFSGEKAACSVDTWPLSSRHVLIVRGRGYRPGSRVHVNASTPETVLILLTRSNDGTLRLNGANELGRTTLSRELTKIELLVTGRYASIELDDASWILELHRTVSWTYPHDREVEFEGVQYTALGNVCLVDTVEAIALLSDQPIVPDGKLGLWMESGSDRVFAPIATEHVRVNGDKTELMVGQMARERMLGGQYGIFRFVPGTALANDAKPFTFFVPAAAVVVNATSLRERPVVSVLEGMEVVAGSEVTPRSSADRCKGRFRGEGWEIEVRWYPRVFDFVVNEIVGSDCGYQSNIFDFDAHELSTAVFLTDGKPGHLTIGPVSWSVENGERVDVSHAVRMVTLAQGTGCLNLSREGNATKTWTFHSAPTINEAKARFDSLLGHTSTINVEVAGFARNVSTVRAALVSRDVILDVAEVDVSPGEGNKWAATFRFRTTEQHIDHQPLIRLAVSGQCFKTLSVAGIPAPCTNVLEELAAEYRRGPDPRLVPELLHAFVDQLFAKKTLPASCMRALRSLLGTPGGLLEQESALTGAIELLGALARGIPMPTWPLVSGPLSHIESLASSIWLLLSAIHRERGILDVDKTLKAMKAVHDSLSSITDPRSVVLAELALARSAATLARCGRPSQWEGKGLSLGEESLLKSFHSVGINP